MDVIALIVVCFFVYWWFKQEKKWDEKAKEDKKRKHMEYEKFEHPIVAERKREEAERSRKRKKEAIRKQKEESDQAILKAKSERRIREKLKPIQEESIFKQKNAIEEIDQEVVINWHKDIIRKCKKYESRHPDFLADYEAYKASILFLDSLHFELNLNLQTDSMLFENKKYDWEDASNEELYLVKLKNTIDDKLYLVVGIANKSAKEDFANDPVVELVEVVSSISLNKNVALFLKECLLNQYKPQGEFDPFAKFDSYEGVIELRFIKQSLKMIKDFENNKKSAEVALKNSERVDFKELEEIFENYHLNDYKNFNDYYVAHIGRKMPISYGDFLDSLYELFQSNILYLNEVGSYYQSELDELNQSYPLWLQKQIDIVEDHVYQAIYTYDSNTSWREGKYFSKFHPLGLGFDAEKSIVLLHPKGKIEYKTMNSEFMEKEELLHSLRNLF
jgi:hypothetical protein